MKTTKKHPIFADYEKLQNDVDFWLESKPKTSAATTTNSIVVKLISFWDRIQWLKNDVHEPLLYAMGQAKRIELIWTIENKFCQLIKKVINELENLPLWSQNKVFWEPILSLYQSECPQENS